jgi:hypothetical protein
MFTIGTRVAWHRGMRIRFDRGTLVLEAEIESEQPGAIPGAAIVVGGTSSPRRHAQRIGRVLRPRDGKRARVYELAVSGTTEMSNVQRRREGLGGRASLATGGVS